MYHKGHGWLNLSLIDASHSKSFQIQAFKNKKAVLSQGNRAMPQLLFSV